MSRREKWMVVVGVVLFLFLLFVANDIMDALVARTCEAAIHSNPSGFVAHFCNG